MKVLNNGLINAAMSDYTKPSYGYGRVRVKAQIKIITIILVQLYIHKFYSYLHHLFLISISLKQYLSLQYEAVMVIAPLEYLLSRFE